MPAPDEVGWSADDEAKPDPPMTSDEASVDDVASSASPPEEEAK
jgi:hypothetical protein